MHEERARAQGLKAKYPYRQISYVRGVRWLETRRMPNSWPERSAKRLKICKMTWMTRERSEAQRNIPGSREGKSSQRNGLESKQTWPCEEDPVFQAVIFYVLSSMKKVNSQTQLPGTFRQRHKCWTGGGN